MMTKAGVYRSGAGMGLMVTCYAAAVSAFGVVGRERHAARAATLARDRPLPEVALRMCLTENSAHGGS